jgi:hypothetical protein
VISLNNKYLVHCNRILVRNGKPRPAGNVKENMFNFGPVTMEE